MGAYYDNHLEGTARDLIPPPRGPSDLLPLRFPDEYRFQELCRDLLRREPGIRSSSIYGPRGQGQRGVDLKADREDGGSELGQCKRVKDITEAEIKSVTDEFFKYWAFWKSRKAHRFILFLACRAENTKIHAAIESETARFAEKGIIYEVWDQVEITEKARSHTDLVITHFTENWAARIGASVRSVSLVRGGGEHALLPIAGTRMIAELGAVSDEAVSKRLEGIKEIWDRGDPQTALTEVEELIKSRAWDSASPEARASGLRIEAGLLLAMARGEPLSRAALAAERAEELDPEADYRPLQALIARLTSGAEDALRELDGPKTVAILNLQAQLNLELGRLEAAEAALGQTRSHFEPDGETLRTEALLFLLRQDTEAAFRAISKAEEMSPHSAAILLAKAMVCFWSSVSPAALPSTIPAVPPPIEWRFVKQDDATRERLAAGAEILRDLARADTLASLGAKSARAWHVGCLGNDTVRQKEAAALCRELLDEEPVRVPAARWALVRGWAVDLESVANELRVDSSEHDPAKSEIIVQYLLTVREPREALRSIEEARDLFEETGNAEAFHYWRGICLGECGQVSKALVELSQCGDDVAAVLAGLSIVRDEPNGSDALGTVVSQAESLLAETEDCRLLLGLCELRASAGEWGFVAEHGEQLMACMGTPAALLLYSMALCNVDRHEECLNLLSANAGLFPEGRLPSRFLVIRAACQRALGLIPKAKEDARRAFEEDPTQENILHAIQLTHECGDQAGVVSLGRELLNMEDTQVRSLLHLARMIRAYDSQFAVTLLESAHRRGVPDELIAEALDLSHVLLGAEDERTSGLVIRTVELGNKGEGGIRIASQDELKSLIETRAGQAQKAFQLYADGQIPVHILSAFISRPVAACLATLTAQDWRGQIGDRIPPFLHSGRRLPEMPADWAPARLVMDSTALLVAEKLHLLDAAEQTFSSVLIPFHTMQSLVRAQDMLVSQAVPSGIQQEESDKWSGAVAALIERIRRGLESEKYKIMPAPAPDSVDPFPDDPEILCLCGLLLCQTHEGDLLWSDDRYMNGHAMMGAARIASTYEMAHMLHELGVLPSETLDATAQTLRQWRVMFLPVTSSEIMRCVAAARGSEGSASRVMRRWIATSLLNGKRLQIPSAPASLDRGEFAAFLDLHRAIEDSVVQIWKDTRASLEDRACHAGWVLEELYAPALTMRRLTNLPRDLEAPFQLEALSLSGLFVGAFIGQLPPSEWKAYFGWLYSQTLEVRSRSEPLLLRATAQAIAEMLVFCRTAWDSLGFGEREKLAITVFVDALPNELKMFILEDETVCRELGFGPTISVGDCAFDPSAFYSALRVAQEDGEAELSSLGGGKSIVVQAMGESPATEFRLTNEGTSFTFVGEELALLSGSISEREAFLRTHRDWFDVTEEEYEGLVSSISAEPSQRRRVERAHERKTSSIAQYYSGLGAMLVGDGPVPLQSFMPPDLKGAIHYFGLEDLREEEGSAAADLDRAATKLLQEFSLRDVFHRFSGLPAPMPPAILEHLARIPEPVRRERIRELLQSSHSAMSRFHVLRLLLTFKDDCRVYGRMARILAGALLSQSACEQAEMLLAILAWVENEFSWTRELDSFPETTRLSLAWSHANALVQLFSRAGASQHQKAAAFFRGAGIAAIRRDALAPKRHQPQDVMHSRRVAVETLLLSSLCYALSDSEQGVLSERCLDRVRGLLFEEADGAPTIRLPFLRASSSLRNVMGSVLGGIWSTKLAPIVGEDLATIWSTGVEERRIRSAFEAVRSGGAKELQGWLTLGALFGDLDTARWRDELRECIAEADFMTLAKHATPQELLACHFACSQAEQLGDADLPEQLGEACVGIAGQLGKGAETDARSESEFLLLDSILRLSRAAGTAAAAAARAAEIITRAVDQDCRLAEAWRAALVILVSQLPVEEAQQLWPVLLKMRAIA